MHILAVVVLLYCLGVVAYDALTGNAEFTAFKRETETLARQRFYMRWLLKSVLLFLFGGMAGLRMLGQLHSLSVFPEQFAAAHAALVKLVPAGQLSHDFLVGFGGAVLAGVVLGSVFAGVLSVRRSKAGARLIVGDIQALFPRNRAEMVWTALLSLNAGLSEEIFFRLVLPLALVTLFGHAVVCFAVAVVLFGFLHLYQNAVGAVAAAFLGLVLTAIYVGTGSLWIAVLVHAAIDLNGLVLRPAVAWWLAKKNTVAEA